MTRSVCPRAPRTSGRGSSSSRPLARAADYETEIDITAMCSWVKLGQYEDRSKHFPQMYVHPNRDEDPFRGSPGYRAGIIGPNGLALDLCKLNSVWHATVEIGPRDYGVIAFHHRAKLLDYLAVKWGELVW